MSVYYANVKQEVDYFTPSYFGNDRGPYDEVIDLYLIVDSKEEKVPDFISFDKLNKKLKINATEES